MLTNHRLVQSPDSDTLLHDNGLLDFEICAVECGPVKFQVDVQNSELNGALSSHARLLVEHGLFDVLWELR